eukprot:GHVS01053890.1.p1 GENE.GHVS01053890.1~~GHVS01053890.1.p1  ORF type:complete len:123 (+),score=12.23 GHVS01053890.1:3-371(+)
MQRFQSVSDIAAEDTEIARMAMQRFQSVSDIAAEDADFQQPLEALHGGQPTDGDHLPENQAGEAEPVASSDDEAESDDAWSKLRESVARLQETTVKVDEDPSATSAPLVSVHLAGPEAPVVM